MLVSNGKWMDSNLGPLASPNCATVGGKKNCWMGGSPCLVTMGEDSCSKGCGFKSQHHLLNGHFSTLICCTNVNVCLKR